jgi:hypothetical protein
MRCSYCGSLSHTKANCPYTLSGSVRRTRIRCTYCGARDHEIAACPKTWDGNAARAWHPNTVADHFVLDKA